MTPPAPGELKRLGSVLHLGCGGDHLPAWMSCEREVRLDIDPSCSPDIVGDMRDLGQIGPFDAIYSSHNLEHLYPHEVVPALEGFLRILAPGGYLLALVPDLEDVRATDEVLFVAPCGPITGLDLIYGHRAALPESLHMAHHCGFTRATLEAVLLNAGFARVNVTRGECFNLIAAAVKA